MKTAQSDTQATVAADAGRRPGGRMYLELRAVSECQIGLPRRQSC